MKTALLAGGTGLVGSQLLLLLLDSPRYDKIIAVGRTSLGVVHPKLEDRTVDFNSLSLGSQKIDDVFCCLGTTMKQAKTKEAFHRVDVTYPVALASQAKILGSSQFFLVSAMGASASSMIYYNRQKAEVEQRIKDTGFKSLHIFRPSLLLGQRTNRRAGEESAQQAFRMIGFLIPKKYKAIEGATVARAMLACASKDEQGFFVHESKEMQGF
jgi:uncharacterized protein YbjT (DUF2867 family)